jgi:EAL and modified HD-GYP domain-containing signal transduction protein
VPRSHAFDSQSGATFKTASTDAIQLSPALNFANRNRDAWYLSNVSSSPQPASVGAPPPPPLATPQPGPYTRYLARQPILNRDQNTHGYELLFRSGPDNFFCASDPDAATCHTIDFSLLFGPTALTGGRVSFINCTRNILLRDVITLLPRDRVVIEILEGVLADEETLAACDRLHRAGYQIALDDYVPTPNTLRLLPFADVIKVDFLATDAARQTSIAADMRRRGIRLLAEKVETREQFQFALGLGFHYFQGYFFSKPEPLTMQDIPCSKLAYVHVMSLANRDDFDVDKLEQAILREPSLCYRLLRYLNSAAFGLFPIRSIRHAVSLLGQREMRKWVSIAVAISLSSDRSGELISSALVRARCCELLAPLCREDASGAFIVGIMSLMDAILNRPMEAVISQLPLTAECKSALRGDANTLGNLLRVATWCERGAWEEISAFACESGIPEATILNIHRNACRWADEILQENRAQQ